MPQKKLVFPVKTLAVGAVCLAASFVLSYIRLFHMPQGGSITLLSMMPILLFAYLYGLGPGLLAGLAYGLLQTLQDPYIVSALQYLLDYPIAFAVLGFAGALKPFKLDDRIKLPVSLALGSFLRVLSHFVSGMVFFGSYVPAGQSPILYSLWYQLSTVGPDALLCVIASVFLVPTGLLKAVRRYM